MPCFEDFSSQSFSRSGASGKGHLGNQPCVSLGSQSLNDRWIIGIFDISASWEATRGTGFIKPWLLLGYLQLCYLSFGMKGCECCETGCGFTHSTWPLKYRKQESVTPPCSVPGRLHYPAKICVVFAGLPNCHGICSAKKLLLPSGLQIKLCLSHCKKTCPKPQKSLHADLLRSMTRASVLSGDFPTFGSSNPEMLSLQYPKFLVHGSKDAKDIQRLQDASGILQQYHRFISL